MRIKTFLLTLFFVLGISISSIAQTVPSLTNLTSPTGDDLLYIVDDPTGTSVGKKVTVANLFGANSLTGLSDVGSATQGAGRLLVSDGSNWQSVNTVTINGTNTGRVGGDPSGEYTYIDFDDNTNATTIGTSGGSNNETLIIDTDIGDYVGLKSSKHLYLDTTNGNVGIGTTGPAYPLDVGTTGQVARFGNTAVGGQSWISMGNDRANFGYDGPGTVDEGNLAIQGGSGKGIEFNVNNTTFGSGTVMIIKSGGNVGIGTTGPGAKLDVNGVVTIRTGGSANNAVCWKADGITLGYCSTQPDASGDCTCN